MTLNKWRIDLQMGGKWSLGKVKNWTQEQAEETYARIRDQKPEGVTSFRLVRIFENVWESRAPIGTDVKEGLGQ